MSEYMICNLMPTYKEAPVSCEQFCDQTSQILSALRSHESAKKYIIYDKNSKNINKCLQDEQVGEDITLIALEAKGAFTFGNKTAVMKVIHGEKPMPSGVNNELPVYSVEELLKSNTKTIYIEGNAKKKGAFTFPKEIKPSSILEQCSSNKEFKGMYFGYPMGLMIGKEQLEDVIELTTDYVYIFDQTDCMLDQLLRIAVKYGAESCGRCVFGFEGVTQINMILSDIAQKKGKSDDIELLLDLCGEMKKQSLCDIGVSAANSVLTAMKNFKEEIEEHITKKICREAVCSKFVTYHILPNLCTGCTDCVDACEDEAILGKKKFIHVIDQDECILCGACVTACEEGAIIKAGAIKPKCPKKPIPCT